MNDVHHFIVFLNQHLKEISTIFLRLYDRAFSFKNNLKILDLCDSLGGVKLVL